MPLLYKFFKVDTEDASLERIKQIVEQNTLWASSPASCNDPFELKFALAEEHDENRIRARYFKDKPQNSEQEYLSWREDLYTGHFRYWLENTFRIDLINRYSLTCFTQNPNNLLMWSHYGPNHLSFCVAFDYSLLLKMDDLEMYGAVKYSKRLKVFNYFRQSERTLIRNVFFTKADAWKYEKEVRLVFAKRGVHKFPAEALKGIILGCRAYPKLRSYVRGLLENDRLRYTQMAENPVQYSLNELPVEKNAFVTTSVF